MESPIAQPESPYELARRIENLARKGTVAAVRLKRPAAVRVRIGDNTTDWLPWFALRAGGARGGRKWHPPVVGEQAMVIATGGDLGQGVALLGLYSDAMPQGSEQQECERTDWDHENFMEWLRGVFTLLCMREIHLRVSDRTAIDMDTTGVHITTPSTSLIMRDNTVTIRAGSATLTIASGGITANVDIVAQNISLTKHRHRDVERGSDTSGVPV